MNSRTLAHTLWYEAMCRRWVDVSRIRNVLRLGQSFPWLDKIYHEPSIDKNVGTTYLHVTQELCAFGFPGRDGASTKKTLTSAVGSIFFMWSMGSSSMLITLTSFINPDSSCATSENSLVGEVKKDENTYPLNPSIPASAFWFVWVSERICPLQIHHLPMLRGLHQLRCSTVAFSN